MSFFFLPRAARDELRAARLDAETADRVAAVMRETNTRLEARIRELQSRLSQAERDNEALRSRADASTESHLLTCRFLQRAEPELRKSLDAVAGFAQLLREEVAVGQRPLAGNLLEGLQRMRKIVDQMADVAPLDSIGLALEEVEAGELVGAACKAAAMEVARRGGSLQSAAPTPVRVRADAAWIRHAIGVFISRALSRAGMVEANATAKGSLVRFEVGDRGPDLDEAALAAFFADPDLAMCRRVIELHGGALEVASRPGLGCTVAFTLAAIA